MTEGWPRRAFIRHSTLDIRHSRAFTLLELVLVLVVMAMLMALAAPSLRGWSRGSKLRDAADGVLAAARFARSQAIATATVHHLEIDSSGYRVTMQRPQQGDQFVAAAGEFGQVTPLPGDIRLELTRGDNSTASVIEFHPTGRSTPAQVMVVSSWGESITLVANNPAEPLREQVAGVMR